MANIITTRELFNDCYLLFGPNYGLSMDYLKKLLPSELKSAYRKKALQTHPDRAKVLGITVTEMEVDFKKVTLAYERLFSFVNGAKEFAIVDGKPTRGHSGTNGMKNNQWNKNSQWSKNNQWSKDKQKATDTDHFYKGFIPERQLLIVQYLYYTGAISWKTFFDAIFWQRNQRPLVGQIAREWGILTPDEISEILCQRGYKERFVEYARDNGYITHFQFLAIMGKQKKLQRPIGEYFTQNGIFTDREINKIVENLRIHNSDLIF